MKNLFKILGIVGLGIVVVSCNSGAVYMQAQEGFTDRQELWW
jgi:hypothetical protein